MDELLGIYDPSNYDSNNFLDNSSILNFSLNENNVI